MGNINYYYDFYHFMYNMLIYIMINNIQLIYCMMYIYKLYRLYIDI